MKQHLTFLLIVLAILAGLAAYTNLHTKGVVEVPTSNVSDVVSSQPDAREVKLYVYNKKKDMDSKGNVLCSPSSVIPVSRMIPWTRTPGKDTINLLLQGHMTDAEKEIGLSTGFPLSGFSLSSATLSGHTLTMQFTDPKNASSGGSCRVTLLRAQLEKTALQFDPITEVRFAPNEVLQP